MRVRHGLTAGIVWLAGCFAADPGEAVSALGQPVTHGSRDETDRAVVALCSATGAVECTGTLISARNILTAAHCLRAGLIDHVVLGTDATAPTRSLAIASTHAHPAFALATMDNDIGIIELASDAELEPFKLDLSRAPAPGDSVIVVGYGHTSLDPNDDHYGERQSGSAKITQVDGMRIAMSDDPSQPCSGDSGGPVLGPKAGSSSVIAVTSFGDPKCENTGVATRIDVFADFIAPWLDREAPPSGCSISAAHSSRPGPLFWLSAGVLCLLRRRRSRL
jgi:secreted trypsin-like serine protease